MNGNGWVKLPNGSVVNLAYVTRIRPCLTRDGSTLGVWVLWAVPVDEEDDDAVAGYPHQTWLDDDNAASILAGIERLAAGTGGGA